MPEMTVPRCATRGCSRFQVACDVHTDGAHKSIVHAPVGNRRGRPAGKLQGGSPRAQRAARHLWQADGWATVSSKERAESQVGRTAELLLAGVSARGQGRDRRTGWARRARRRRWLRPHAGCQGRLGRAGRRAAALAVQAGWRADWPSGTRPRERREGHARKKERAYLLTAIADGGTSTTRMELQA
jgi:hypothetical protein